MIKLSKPQWLNYRYRRGGRRVLNRSTEWGKVYVDGWQEFPIYWQGARYGRSYSVSRAELLMDDYMSGPMRSVIERMAVPKHLIYGEPTTAQELRALHRKE